eukprot:3563772-Prymnesium_polylepis.1
MTRIGGRVVTAWVAVLADCKRIAVGAKAYRAVVPRVLLLVAVLLHRIAPLTDSVVRVTNAVCKLSRRAAVAVGMQHDNDTPQAAMSVIVTSTRRQILRQKGVAAGARLDQSDSNGEPVDALSKPPKPIALPATGGFQVVDKRQQAGTVCILRTQGGRVQRVARVFV